MCRVGISCPGSRGFSVWDCVLINNCDFITFLCCQLIRIIVRAALYCSTFKDVYCGTTTSGSTAATCCSCLIASAAACLAALSGCCNCNLACHIWVNSAMIGNSLALAYTL